MLRGIERLFRSIFLTIKQVLQLIVLVEAYPLKLVSNPTVTELILIESTVLAMTAVAISSISSRTIKPITVAVTPLISILRLSPMRNCKIFINKVKIA
jgi:hypothetical protein